MPLLRSRKLTCFYCGCRSAHVQTPGLRQWTCENCEAENWLDEHGEITDPPVSASGSNTNTRFAQPEPVSSVPSLHPVIPATPADLFCQTCQKNQHLYTQSLANFYPSSTINNVADFERAEREYRASLEERYPLVCEDCEPRVSARLKKINYNAKADHMGRVIERLRGGRAKDAGSWKGRLIWMGGLMWLLSCLCQLAWDAAGIMPPADHDLVFDPTIKSCVRFSLRTYETLPTCLERMDNGPAFYGVLLGVLALWWHPKRSEMLEKRYGSVLGLSEYYKLQTVALGVRFGAWYWVNGINDANTQRGLHLLLAVFTALAMTISYRSVTMDYTPKVCFKESPEPLIKRKTGAGNPQAPSQATLRRSNDPISRSHPFSINDLAPPSPRQETRTRLPTPPPEADYDDATAMEWTPSKPVLSSRYPAPFRPPQSQQSQPSPFQGRLPQNIVSPAHRLRNPPNQPHILAASAQKKASLFPSTSQRDKTLRNTRSTGHALDMHSMSAALIDSPTSTTTFNDNEDGLSVFSDLSPSKIQHPRFFPGIIHEETGLEGIMEKAFRIDEIPQEVKDVHGRDVAVARVVEREEMIKKKMLTRAFIGVVMVAVIGVAISQISVEKLVKVGAWKEIARAVGQIDKGLKELVGVGI